VASIIALALTVAAALTGTYSALSNRATRWGDSLIIGPRFTGAFSLDGGATQYRFWREKGSPVMNAPNWKGKSPITLTFLWGFTIYHTPPGTLRSIDAPAN
jgi:hypothetical protein